MVGAHSIYSDINNAGYTIATSYANSEPSGYLHAPNGSVRGNGHLPVEHPITEVYALNNRNQVADKSGPGARCATWATST